MRPNWPALDRKATSSSPRSLIRSGAPPGSSSDDITTGIQYCRNNSPVGVPGPTRVKTCVSFMAKKCNSPGAMSNGLLRPSGGDRLPARLAHDLERAGFYVPANHHDHVLTQSALRIGLEIIGA